MFSPNSRYANATTYTVRTADGRTVTVARLPIRERPSARGFHARTEGQRLDHIAAHFLADATAAWHVCDANDAVAPDALAAREQIAIPRKR